MSETTAPASADQAATQGASYIGSEKVVVVADTDKKTPMGAPIVEVTFENGSKEFMPKKTYEIVVTDVASDASIVRRSKFNALVPAVKAVICEFDISVAEIQPLLQEIAASIDNNFARATSFAWTKDDSLFVPNSNPLYGRTLLEAHEIITSIPKEEVAPVAPAAAGEAVPAAEAVAPAPKEDGPAAA